MNSNLRPELRADKNGRLVTKHVRDNQSGSSKAPLSIPKVFGIKSQINVMGKWDESTNIKVTDMMRAVDPDGLKAFRDAFVVSDDRSKAEIQKVIEYMAYRHKVTPLDEVERALHYSALLMPVLHQIHPKDNFTFKAALGVFAGIAEKYGQEAPPSILLGTDEQKHLIIGRFMSGEAHIFKDTTPEQDEWLGANAEALLPHFDRLRYMRELDMDLCRELVNTASPSMSSGIL